MDKLTFVIPIPPKCKEEDILATLGTIPWTKEIEIKLITDSSEKIVDLLKDDLNYLPRSIDNPDIEIIECKATLEEKKDLAIRATSKNNYITFINPGTEITDVKYEEILKKSDDILFGYNDLYYKNDNYKNSIESGFLEATVVPESDEGIIFSVKTLQRVIDNDRSLNNSNNRLIRMFDLSFITIVNDFSYELTVEYSLISQPRITTLEDEEKIIQECIDYWENNKVYSGDTSTFRKIIWLRLQKAAFRIVSGTAGEIQSRFLKYLDPESINKILV